MERLKSITIIFLLVVGLLNSIAPPICFANRSSGTKPASVLLQEGLYAEEIEGDLDAAIKIYEQVIAEAKKVQRTAAQATYRIGVCYLKKGQEDKAAEYFQNIISNFPSQKALVAKAQNQLDKIKPKAEKIVEQAVMTISKCAEGDPRVAKALESLKGLDENVVVSELVKFLNSETDTVRRSAIYILWKGDLKDVSAAVPTLEKLCSHKEDITRGMAVISLGAARIKSSFETLANMTLEDPSGYARRCAAYALGLMGNAEAKPILEKALEDSDLLVRNNAKAALTMLEPPAVGGFGPAKVVRLYDIDHPTTTEKECAIDFDTGKLSKIPPQARQMPGDDLMKWLSGRGIDAVAEIAGKDRGLIGVYVAVKTMPPYVWDKISPTELRALMVNNNSARQETTPMLLEDEDQKVFVFRTRDSGLGVLQILDVDKSKQMVQFRYKMLQEPAKIAPVEVFGPVMERVINDDGEQKHWLIDFDTGRLFSHSTEIRSEEAFLRWIAENRIDAMGETRASSPGLYGFDMAVIPVAAEKWETISPKGLANELSIAKGGTPAVMSAVGNLPVTYIFKTREGGMGVVQILEMQHNKKPRQFRIRYKMLQKESAGRIVFLPDADDVIQQGKVAVVLDLTTGKMLPGNKDKQYFNKLNKGDVAYFDDEGKDLLVCFRGAKITRKTANGKYYDTPDQSHTDNTVHIYIIKKTPAEWTITTKEGDIYELKVLSLDNDQAKIKYRKIPAGGKVWTIKPDLSTPEATIKSFVKAVYDGNLEAAGACVSKDGADYDEFKEMLATESNHPFQAMIKAMDVSIPVEIISKDITEDRCKIKWYFTLGRVYYIGDTKINKGTHQKFGSYLELVGDKWLIRDI